MSLFRTLEQKAELLASDGQSGDFLGCAVALDADTAVIGAYGDDDDGHMSGSAYVFVRAGEAWTEQAKLAPSDAAMNKVFGVSVAVEGDTAIVGAPYDDEYGVYSGAAYVFVRSDGLWVEQAKLVPSDAGGGKMFGYALAMDGDTTLIGSNYSIYVFVHSGGVWTQYDRLYARPHAVDLDDGFAVVGDPRSGSQWGRASVLRGSTWTGLYPEDWPAHSSFGCSVAIDEGTVLVGARSDDDNGAASGSVYVFDTGGFQSAKLWPADGIADQGFGQSVALVGDTALIGAYLDDANGVDSGAVYTFARSDGAWTERDKFLPAAGLAGDRVGQTLAVDGDTALIGAMRDDGNGSDAGSVYVVRLVPPDADEDGIPDSADLCPGTAIPESVPTNHLGVNRWALVDDDGLFDTTPPPGGGAHSTSISRSRTPGAARASRPSR